MIYQQLENALAQLQEARTRYEFELEGMPDGKLVHVKAADGALRFCLAEGEGRSRGGHGMLRLRPFARRFGPRPVLPSTRTHAPSYPQCDFSRFSA